MLNILSNRPLRVALLGGTLAFGSLLSAPASAQFGGAIYCTNCASTIQQAAQLAKQVETAINTANQLRMQTSQYAEMLKQGATLPASIVRRMTSDLEQVSRLYQQSKSLAGQAANFDKMFRDQFKGYNDYSAQRGQSARSMQSTYQRWSDQGFDSMRVAMRSAGMNVSTLSDEDDLLSQMVQRSQNAGGRMQAIQAGNEIASMQVQQMMKLRQLMNDQIQSQSMFYAQQIERQSMDDAARQMRATPKVIRGGGKEY